jgi:tRNA threonylcarbamoyladenosine biosynthesis protein TsaB
MALILNIETSTEICSVSISKDGKCIALKMIGASEIETGRGSHSKLLAPFMKELLEQNNVLPENLDALAVSSGPGSYTGLRIGVSTCKGFCFGANLPLIAINTLQIMANMAEHSMNDYDLYVPMIDAKRMEVYTAIFDEKVRFISNVEAKVIDENSFAEFKSKKVAFFGNGSDKCEDILRSDNFLFLKNIYPSAEYMGSFAEQYFNENKFVDLVYFEPFYLKEFVTTTPKNKIQNLLHSNNKLGS